MSEGDLQSLELCFGNVADTLSQLIRTALIAPEGKTLAVCDFSAIEARVLAWLAGEEWVLDTFRQGGDIYCATASQMFHVPVEKHGRNAELRQKGKIAVLALGYGGGVGALDAMGGQRLGMSEDEEAETVKRWRAANPAIVAFWKAVEANAINVLTYEGYESDPSLPVSFRKAPDGTTLLCRLPSGRDIAWPQAQPTVNRFGSTSIKYRGVDQQTQTWTWLETYGGKLTENITQAVARDCLAAAMTVVSRKYPIVFHVHDELICEVPEAEAEKALAWIQNVFTYNLDWNAGLPLSGSGYTTPYYRKD